MDSRAGRDTLVLANRGLRVLDGRMRAVLLHTLMGVMLFCGVESAADTSVMGHHGDGASHEIHEPTTPPPDHDDDDCAHFCHCAAHLPSMPVVLEAFDLVAPGTKPSWVPPQAYASRAIAPLLRPPAS